MKDYLPYLLILLILTSCKQEIKEEPNVFYTCSMDPQVMEKKPGKCPICRMDLAKTIVSPSDDKNSLKLSETQIKLASIKTMEVQNSSLGEGLYLRATLVTNQRNIEVVSSSISGRVDRLYFKEQGEKIQKGDRIYDIYSEELQAAIQQYLLLKAKAMELKGSSVNYKEMLKAARDKLMIWGLTEQQVSNLNNKDLGSIVPFYSKESGVVTEVVIREGDYVDEGATIIRTANYSTLWVEAEAYPSDMKYVSSGDNVKVKVEAFPNEEIEGQVSFENPELQAQSKINLIRVEIVNKDRKYKPGMRATINIYSKNQETLTVSEEAVLYQPKMNVVYIQNENGTFAPRMVQVGIKSNHKVEILSGLKQGEKVVISGVYLLDSEYQLRNGAGGMGNMPGMEGGMENKNKEGMNGMKMPGM